MPCRGRHPHNPSFGLRYGHQTSGSDDFFPVNRHKKGSAGIDVGSLNVVQIGVDRFVDKAEMLSESFKDKSADLVQVGGMEAANLHGMA